MKNMGGGNNFSKFSFLNIKGVRGWFRNVRFKNLIKIINYEVLCFFANLLKFKDMLDYVGLFGNFLLSNKFLEFVLYNFPDPNILPPRETVRLWVCLSQHKGSTENYWKWYFLKLVQIYIYIKDLHYFIFCFIVSLFIYPAINTYFDCNVFEKCI